MLGEVKGGHVRARRQQPKETRFELMLPPLREAESLLPGNGSRDILDAKAGFGAIWYSRARVKLVGRKGRQRRSAVPWVVRGSESTHFQLPPRLATVPVSAAKRISAQSFEHRGP